MSTIEMSRVFFGARQVGYTGRESLNAVGREGILVLYTYPDAPGECILVFHYDRGPDIGWVRHARSRFEIAGGTLRARSLRSGTEKLYLIGDAIEATPGVFNAESFDLDAVPREWASIYVSIWTDHCWRGAPTVELET